MTPGRRIRFLRGELPPLSLQPRCMSPSPTPLIRCSAVKWSSGRAKHCLWSMSTTRCSRGRLNSMNTPTSLGLERRGWRFVLLQEYAEAKATGAFDGDFKTCCETSATDVVIPAHMVARTESKQTMANKRFAELETFLSRPLSNQAGE